MTRSPGILTDLAEGREGTLAFFKVYMTLTATYPSPRLPFLHACGFTGLSLRTCTRKALRDRPWWLRVLLPPHGTMGPGPP